MKRPRLLSLVLALLVISLVATGCGGSTAAEQPTAVTGAGAGSTPAAGGGSTGGGGGSAAGGGSAQDAKVGAPVDEGTFTITLESATLADGVLTAKFLIDNSSGTDVVYIPTTALVATDPSGSPLDANLVCSTLATSVAAQAKLEGPVCWNLGGTSTTGVKVKFVPMHGAGDPVTWTLP
jgi:hypothetical protein